jgi:hypothetical protein
MLGHELMGDSSTGFDEESFDLDILKDKIRQRPLH